MIYEPLILVARKLAHLRSRVVFVGGMVRGLLITDPAAGPPRATKDVDLIVGIASRLEFHRLCDALRRLGFREDATKGAPICRWVVSGIHVDVMPDDESILGFRNRWYSSALEHPLAIEIAGESLRIIDAPHFCATKLEAFGDRGGGDFYHHDIEDVISVVDGRAELADEIRRADPPVREYIRASLSALLASPDFVEVLPGHLPGDDASQRRLPTLLHRLRELTMAG